MTATFRPRPQGHPMPTPRKEVPFMSVHDALVQARLDEQLVHVNAARQAAARDIDASKAANPALRICATGKAFFATK